MRVNRPNPGGMKLSHAVGLLVCVAARTHNPRQRMVGWLIEAICDRCGRKV